MKAMIFAAGLGTRLKPMTDTMPKALVPICGKPLIEHVARKLHAAGIDETVINVHHFAEQIEEWIASQDWMCMGDASAWSEGKMLVHVSDERKMLLETGGAVLNARRYLEDCGQFLIYNVDILSDIDIRWFALQAKPNALATLLVSNRQSSRCLLFEPESMRLVGWMNNVTGEVRSPYPVDKDKCLKLAFSGIHIMSDKIFDAMHQYAQAHALYVFSDTPRFPIMDFYIWACARYDIFGVQADGMTLLDVGKQGSIEQAEELIRVLPL